MRYPEATRGDLVEHLHGRSVPDPYRWLEDADSERTRSWAREQDETYQQHLTTWGQLGRAEQRVSELLATGMVGVPVWRRERCFVMRRAPGQQHAVLVVEEPAVEESASSLGGDETQVRRVERVLIDPMALDPLGLTTLDAWQPSKEGDLLAYQTSTGGTEESVLRVLDVATVAVVDGPIDRTRYSPVAFLPGGSAYYYVRTAAAAGAARGRAAVPPPGGVAPRRHRSRPRRRGLRLRAGPAQLLRRPGLPRRSLAVAVVGDRDGAAQRPVDRRPRRVPAGSTAAAPGRDRAGRPDRRPRRTGRPAVPDHRSRRAPQAPGRDRPRRPGAVQVADPGRGGSGRRAGRLRRAGRPGGR